MAGFWGRFSRRLRDMNRARFEVVEDVIKTVGKDGKVAEKTITRPRYEGFYGNVMRHGFVDAGFTSLGEFAATVGKAVGAAPFKLGNKMVGNPFRPAKTNLQRANRFMAGEAKDFGKGFVRGGAIVANKNLTGLFHGAKGIGKLITQKDPTHILGRSINPIAGDAMILGGAALGMGMAWRGARLNSELGTINIAPVEGTMADLEGLGEEGAINSPDMERNRTWNIEHFGTNNNLGIALGMHYARRQGTLHGGLQGMGVI